MLGTVAKLVKIKSSNKTNNHLPRKSFQQSNPNKTNEIPPKGETARQKMPQAKKIQNQWIYSKMFMRKLSSRQNKRV